MILDGITQSELRNLYSLIVSVKTVAHCYQHSETNKVFKPKI